MKNKLKSIKLAELKNSANFFNKKSYADCLIINKTGKIVLQKRPYKNKYLISLFGGHIEENESPLNALKREIKEELGANIIEEEVIFLGAITEDFTNHEEVIYVYFWKDKNDTITGCYEFEKVLFDNAEKALKEDNLMEYSYWAILEAIEKKLIT